MSDSSFSDVDVPKYILTKPNENLIDVVFSEAETVRTSKRLMRSSIVIIFFDRLQLDEAISFAEKNNKAFVLLTKRGDIDALNTAQKNNAFVLALADYVGGLEFDAAILGGVDSGRVPQNGFVNSVASKQFQNYLAHNKVYVAVTRARKVVRVIGEKSRGVSDVFAAAIEHKHIELQE